MIDHGKLRVEEWAFWPTPRAKERVGMLFCRFEDGERVTAFCDPAWLDMMLASGSPLTRKKGVDFGSGGVLADLLDAAMATRRIAPNVVPGWPDDPDFSFSKADLDELAGPWGGDDPTDG